MCVLQCHDMTYLDFVDELAAAGISGREFARLLRLNENTIANYKAKKKVPSNLATVAALMRLLKENGIQYKARLEALEIQPNAPRGKAIGSR